MKILSIRAIVGVLAVALLSFASTAHAGPGKYKGFKSNLRASGNSAKTFVAPSNRLTAGGGQANGTTTCNTSGTCESPTNLDAACTMFGGGMSSEDGGGVTCSGWSDK